LAKANDRMAGRDGTSTKERERERERTPDRIKPASSWHD